MARGIKILTLLGTFFAIILRISHLCVIMIFVGGRREKTAKGGKDE